MLIKVNPRFTGWRNTVFLNNEKEEYPSRCTDEQQHRAIAVVTDGVVGKFLRPGTQRSAQANNEHLPEYADGHERFYFSGKRKDFRPR
jgi:hypothetical protein